MIKNVLMMVVMTALIWGATAAGKANAARLHVNDLSGGELMVWIKTVPGRDAAIR